MKLVYSRIFAFLACFALLTPLSAEKLEGAQKKAVKKAQRMKVVEVVEDEGAFQAKNLTFSVGKIKYRLKGSLGSYQLFALNEKNNPVSLFASQDEFTSSFYDVRIGKKIYRLNDSAVTITGARKDELGGQMVFTVPKKVRVFIKYEKVKGFKGVKSEIVKFTATVLNRSTKTETVALKSVLDTVLGEKNGTHFSTAIEQGMKSEKSYRNLNEPKWFISSDGSTSIQFLLNGANITEPELVVVGNKDFLSLPVWTPQVNPEHNFDSVLSYNNSAICILWKGVELKPEESASFVYYMAVNTDEKPVDGEKFISLYEESNKELDVDNQYSVKEFEDLFNQALEKYEAGLYPEAYEIVMKLWEKTEHRNERLKELKELIEKKLNPTELDLLNEAYASSDYNYEDDMPPAGLPEPDVPDVPQEVPEASFDINSISADQLNPEYVRGLVDRINSLEADDENIDRNEILRLHAELDAILEKLRHQ